MKDRVDVGILGQLVDPLLNEDLEAFVVLVYFTQTGVQLWMVVILGGHVYID